MTDSKDGMLHRPAGAWPRVDGEHGPHGWRSHHNSTIRRRYHAPGAAPRRCGTSATPWSRPAVVAAVTCACALGLQAALGQQAAPNPPPADGNGANGGGLTATWTRVEKNVQQIDVMQDRSVRVQLSRPAPRVFVGSKEVVDVQVVSPTELLLTGKKIGTTQLMVWAEDETQLVFDVNVEVELDRLRKAVAKTAPLSDIRVESVVGTIVLSGTVRDADTAERIEQIAGLFAQAGAVQNHMTVTGEAQVLLRVTIAEMNRSAARQLGINGFLAGDNFQDVFVVNNIGGVNPANIGAAEGVLSTGTIPFLTGSGGIPVTGATTLSLGFPRVQMQLFLQALKDNGLARTLSEPTLVTVSGQSAEFLAGGEFPIPVPQTGAGGGTTITIEYREFGAQLRFTPTVLAGGRIRMTVNPVVSELDFANSVNLTGFVVPALTTRLAETTVEVGNGQTIVIAGLLSDTLRETSTRVPGLGDVPVLGALFRSVSYQRDISELIIMVTPEVVAPMNPDQVPPVPGHDIIDPNDWELYGLALLESGADPWGNGLTGPGRQEASSQLQEASLDPVAARAGHEGATMQAAALSIFGPWGQANTAEDSTSLLMNR